MRIEHIALWVRDLEKMKDFYLKYFEGLAGEKYVNPEKEFSSYFIKYKNGSRLEIMHKPQIMEKSMLPVEQESLGYTHIAFSAGSKQAVDELTERLRKDGYTVVGPPRHTGDGYYESVVLDPENNRLEITI